MINRPFQFANSPTLATPLASKCFYLASYLIPGIAAYCLVNIEAVMVACAQFTGLSPDMYQYCLFVLFTFGWHIIYPILMLRYVDGLNWVETLQYLRLDRFDIKEVSLVAPLAFLVFCIVASPYMLFFYEDIRLWLESYEIFQIPPHSIFGSYERFYGAPAILLALMMIGNFVGEEIYFRGYLMHKTEFLGGHNWWIGSVLFSLYHLWQIPQTWSLTIPVLAFGLLMQWRQNLYTLIVFHFLFNVAWYPINEFLLSL